MTMLARSPFSAGLLAMSAAAITLAMGSAPALAQTVWRHGVVEAKSDAGFVFMAANKGFGDKRGVKIEMLQFKGDALALKALIAGELESYEGSPGAPIIASTKGADLKLVGCYWPGLTYGIFTRKEITTGEQLKGKAFGISSPGALPDLFARGVLDHYKLSSDDVRFAQMGSDTDRVRAVAAGVIDAAAASTEFMPVIDTFGVKLLLHAHEVTPNYLRFCTYMSPKAIADKNAAAVGFIAAQIEAQRYALANPEETVALAKQVIDAKPDDKRPAYVVEEVRKYQAIDPEMPIPEDKLAWMQDLLVKTGNLEKPGDLKKLIDGSVREKALALLKGSK